MILTFCINSRRTIVFCQVGQPTGVPMAMLLPKSPQLDRCVEGSDQMWAKSLRFPASLFLSLQRKENLTPHGVLGVG